jgi:hypothetical protein
MRPQIKILIIIAALTTAAPSAVTARGRPQVGNVSAPSRSRRPPG